MSIKHEDSEKNLMKIFGVGNLLVRTISVNRCKCYLKRIYLLQISTYSTVLKLVVLKVYFFNEKRMNIYFKMLEKLSYSDFLP